MNAAGAVTTEHEARAKLGSSGVVCRAEFHSGQLALYLADTPPGVSVALSAEAARELTAAAAAGHPCRLSLPLPADANDACYEVHLAPLTRADPHLDAAAHGAAPLRCWAFVRTEPADATAPLEHLSQLIRALSEINQAAPQSLSEPQFFEIICRIATGTGGLLLAWIGVLDGAGILQPVAYAGTASGYLDDLSLSTDPTIPQGLGPAGRAVRSRTRVLTNDFQSSPMTEFWRARAIRFGIGSSVAVPIIIDGTVVGVFSGYSASRAGFGQAELVLFDNLAVDIAFGIQSIQQRARLVQVAAERDASLEQLRSMELSTLAGSIQIELEPSRVWWSEGAAALFGLAPEVAPSLESLLAALMPDIRPMVLAAIEDACTHGVPMEFDLPLLASDGACRWIRMTGIRDRSGASPRLAVVAQDVSLRKRLETELLAAAEGERARLAAELHDDLGQILTGASLLVSAERARAERTNSPHSTLLGELAHTLDKAMTVCRNIAHGAAAAWRGSLREELDRLARSSSVGQVACRFFSPMKSEPRLSGAQAIDLYRIAQEAVTNALKHADCRNIEMTLNCAATYCELTVADDGRGGHADEEAAGIGLRSMRFRAARAGGTFGIWPRAGGGTMVRVFVPVSA